MEEIHVEDECDPTEVLLYVCSFPVEVLTDMLQLHNDGELPPTPRKLITYAERAVLASDDIELQVADCFKHIK